MNKFRYVLVVMIVVCSIFNSLLISMAEETTTGIDYSLEVSTLKALEIIKVDTGNELKLDEITTRAEFATLLGRVMGIVKTDDVGAGRTVFSDVDTDNSAATYINALAEMGIMNGQEVGKFSPDEPLLFEQGLKAIVKALGYTTVAEQKGGYPTGYIGTAVQLKLTRSLDLQMGVSLTNGQVSRLIYNALEVNLMQQISFGNTDNYEAVKGKTLLTERLKITKETGQVTANVDTGLTGAVSVQEGEVVISGVRFKVGNTDADKFLGYLVDYYFKTDAVTDEKILLLIRQSKNNKTLNIKSNDISEATTKSEFKYWLDKENDKDPQVVKLSSDSNVIYNGKAYGVLSGNAVPLGDIMPSSGEVTLIDSDGDGIYNIILVWSYETYVVRYVFNSILYDRHSEKSISLDKDRDNYKISISKDGLPIKVGNINEWNVVEIAESKNIVGEKLVNAIVIQKEVQGTIGEVREDSLVIDGAEYKIAEDYPKNDPLYEYSPGKRGTLYLDIEDKIASSDLFSGSDNKYGYLLKYGMTKGLNGVAQFKILTDEDKWIFVESTEKIKFNGTDYVSSYVVDNIPLNKEYGTDGKTYYNNRQLVTYRLNDKEKLVELNTATDFVNSVDASTYVGYSIDKFSKDYDSKGTILMFYFQKLNINFNCNLAKKFFVPFPQEAESIKDDPEVYGVGSFAIDERKAAVLYDNDEINTTAAMLVYGPKSGSIVGGSITFDKTCVIVDKLVDSINPDTGELTKKLYYFDNGKEETAILFDPELKDVSTVPAFGNYNVKLKDLKRGSAIQIGKDSKGAISEVIIFFNADNIDKGVQEYSENGVVKDTIFSFLKSRYFCYAKTIRKMRNNLLVNAQGNCDNPEFNKTFVTSGIPIYIYDRASNKISSGSSQDIGLNEMVFVQVVWNDAKVIEIIR